MTFPHLRFPRRKTYRRPQALDATPRTAPGASGTSSEASGLFLATVVGSGGVRVAGARFKGLGSCLKGLYEGYYTNYSGFTGDV